MKTIMRRALGFGFVAGTMAWSIVSAAEPPLTKDQVAALLDYPSSRLEMTDATEARNKTAKRKGTALVDMVHTFTAKDHSFAPLSIIVSDAGTLLTHEREDQVRRGLAASFGSWTGFREIVFDRLAKGVAGPRMVGPGGYSIDATVTVSAAKKDVQVILSVPSDGQLVRVAGTERHHALLLETSELIERVVKCAEIAAQIVAEAAKLPKQQVTNIASDLSAPSNEATAPLGGKTNAPEGEPDSVQRRWLVFGALALVLLLALLIYLRRRETR